VSAVRGQWARILIGAVLPAAGLAVAALQDAKPPSVAPPLEALLGRLAERGALYEKAATGFSCEETITVGKFSGKTGENRREMVTRYDTLYEGNPQSGYQEIRLLVEKNESPRQRRLVDPDLAVPGAYDWSLLFTEVHRPHFRFEAAGEEIVELHLADIVAFAGAAPFVRGKRIEEWTGRVWVDRDTGNFLKVEATPNHQDELLPIRMAAWLKAPRLGALPMKRQPRGYRYRLSFTVEKFSLTFPGEAETRAFVLSPRDEEEIRLRIVQTFRNYVFFNVHSEEEFLGSDPGKDGKR